MIDQDRLTLETALRKSMQREIVNAEAAALQLERPHILAMRPSGNPQALS